MKLGELEIGDTFRITSEGEKVNLGVEDGDTFLVIGDGVRKWGSDYCDILDRSWITLTLHKDTEVEIVRDDSRYRGMDEVIAKREREEGGR